MNFLKGKFDEINTSKVEKNIKDNLNNEKQLIILVTGDCFNPVHLMHIDMFNIAKKNLDSEKLEVVGGFLIPTNNNYVREKLGKEAITLKHRNEMIELAIESSDFICNFPLGYTNGSNTTIINTNII